MVCVWNASTGESAGYPAEDGTGRPSHFRIRALTHYTPSRDIRVTDTAEAEASSTKAVTPETQYLRVIQPRVIQATGRNR